MNVAKSVAREAKNEMKARVAEAIMEHTSNALLKLEWNHDGFCPLCSHLKPHHAIGCDVDLALAERGFTTSRNRDAARDCLRLSASKTDTIPAPKVEED